MDMLAYPSKLFFGRDTSKEEFKTSLEAGVPRLYTERHISAADHRFWAQFTTLFDSAEEVFTTLTLAELRRAATDAPENVVTLVEVLTMHLESLVNDPNFAPVPPNNPGGWGALFASTAPPRRVDERDRQKEALNCCRVLSRIVPILYEYQTCVKEDTDIVNLELSALWTAKKRNGGVPSSSMKRSIVRADTKSSEGDNSIDDQFILTDGNETMTDPLQDGTTEQNTNTQEQPCTGYVLLMTLMELLFYSGFTMPWTEEQFVSAETSEISRVHFTIWEAGIGSPVDLSGATSEHLSRRTEVMRLLLVLFSKSMYIGPEKLMDTEKHALNFITMELDRPVVLSFLCSLFNTVSNNQPDSWMPFSNHGHRGSYLSMCLQVLAVLLLHDTPQDTNLFLFYTKKLYRENDFAFLMNGFERYFKSSMDVSQGPFETRNVESTFVKTAEEHISEVLVILWVMTRHNDAFRNFVTKSAHWCTRLLSWLLFVALSNKTHLPTLRQAQISVFLLQDLSAEKRFGENLSIPGTMDHVTLSVRLVRRSGTVALDCLMDGIYFLIFTSSGHLAPIYSNMLLILYNTAPYWKHMSVVSASRLERLLEQFTSPKFLLSNPYHPKLLSLLLDTFSRAIQSHPTENVQLLYVLARSAGLIERMRYFNFEDAILSIHEAWEHAKREGSKLKQLPETPPPPQTPSKNSVLPKPNESEQPKERVDISPVMTKASDFENATEIQSKDGQDEHPLATDEQEEHQAKEVNSVDAKPLELKSDAEEHRLRSTAPSQSNSPPTGSTHTTSSNADSTISEQPPHSPNLNQEKLELAQLVGKDGFVPTHEWVESWVHTLDFTVIMPMLSHLVPRLNEFCANPNVSQSANAHEQVLAFLREESQSEWQFRSELSDAVPFQWTEQSYIWIQSYIWGLVFSIGLIPLSIWLDTRTALFQVQIDSPPENSVNGAIEAVTTLTTSILSQLPFSTPST